MSAHDDDPTEFFALAADLARMEAAETLARATARADRLRYVATLRHAFGLPGDERTGYVTDEGARIAACLDAGVPPYGPL